MTRPGNGPYHPTYADGRYQISLAMSPELHDRMMEDILAGSENRNLWIRRAIEERLDRREKK